MSKLIRSLIMETGIPASTLRTLISTAPERYKVYRIPKKSGGWRTISQPSAQLKIVQRALMEVLLKDLPVHPAAKAYVSGSSIKKNALHHSGNSPIMKLDFKEFFPSITSLDWESYCERYDVPLDVEDIRLSSLIAFRRAQGERTLRLTIGAPSSPMLSNILMHDFDSAMCSRLKSENVVYTRYADDLTFSAPKTGYLNAVPKAIRKTLRELEHPKLALNQKKTVRITAKHRRIVTGLVLANDGRVTIGRDRKRKIRAKVHHFSLGRLSKTEIDQLTGELAFVNAAEPEYLGVLKRTYGKKCIESITSNTPTRHFVRPPKTQS